MAEAFLKKYAPHERVSSAGTQPVAKPNSVVAEAMREVGIDIVEQKPQMLTNDMIDESTCVVNMGCMNSESCPALFVESVLDWGIPDPRGKNIEDVRKIRDIVESRVKSMIANL